MFLDSLAQGREVIILMLVYFLWKKYFERTLRVVKTLSQSNCYIFFTDWTNKAFAKWKHVSLAQSSKSTLWLLTQMNILFPKFFLPPLRFLLPCWQLPQCNGNDRNSYSNKNRDLNSSPIHIQLFLLISTKLESSQDVTQCLHWLSFWLISS